MEVISHDVKLKLPPVGAFIETEPGIYQAWEEYDDQYRAVCNQLGLVLRSDGINTWVRIKSFCYPHCDDFGKCVVILIGGASVQKHSYA